MANKRCQRCTEETPIKRRFRGYLLCTGCRRAIRSEFDGYRRWALSFLTACLLALGTGCDELSNHPTLYVDSSFTPDEAMAVLHGPEQWQFQTDVDFKIEMVSHEDAAKLAKDTQAPMGLLNSIVFVRMSGLGDPACPNAHYPGNAGANTTKNAIGGSSFTCFNESDLNWLSTGPDLGAWQSAAVHELGHSYGLVHDESCGRCTMWPTSDGEQTAELECADLAQYHRLRGWPLPARCAGVE